MPRDDDDDDDRPRSRGRDDDDDDRPRRRRRRRDDDDDDDRPSKKQGGSNVALILIIVAIAVVFGHTAGAYTWIQGMILRSHGPNSPGLYQLANGMFLLSALTVGIGIHWTVRSAVLRGGSGTERRLPGWVRWVLVAALFCSGATIVFAPW